MLAPAYDRSTAAIRLGDLLEPLRTAIVAHAEARQLTVGPAAPACLTRNVRRARRA